MFGVLARSGSKLASVNRLLLHKQSVRMFGAKAFVSVNLIHAFFFYRCFRLDMCCVYVMLARVVGDETKRASDEL